MKDPLEDALGKMKPAEVPARLMARLTASRPQPTAPAAGWLATLFRRWLLPVAAGGCAAVAAFAYLKKTTPVPDPSPQLADAASMPIRQNDYLLGARSVGVVVAPDQRPYRIVEVEWMEQDIIRAKEGGPGVHVETRRREVIPVAIEIY